MFLRKWQSNIIGPRRLGDFGVKYALRLYLVGKRMVNVLYSNWALLVSSYRWVTTSQNISNSRFVKG